MNKSLLKIIGPGLLIAATGVGAGDIAGGAFAGSKLGLAILWAVLLGAFFKYVITEGLARYQLATGDTILEGLFSKYGRPVQIFFLIYLLIWSFAVGSALISASGVATHALIPVFDSPDTGKIVWGMMLSLVGLAIAWHGSYNSFEKIMSGLVGFMFVTVVVTAIFIKPNLTDFVKGLLIPSIPDYINPEGKEQGVMWTLALMGGVGGTLTILSYGYWIREKGRSGHDFLKTCRLDLAVAYIVTALFGIAMIVISSQIDLDRDSSSKLIINLSVKLNDVVGTAGSVMFLFGAWAAVFSSLLGVWQSVPYMFTDFYNHVFPSDPSTNHSSIQPSIHYHPVVNTKSVPYRVYLVSIAILPMLGLAWEFVFIQKIYAVLGSLVIPFIAIALLMLNRGKTLGDYKNKVITDVMLVLIVCLFVYLVF